jgi:hypothetical protein
MHAFLHSVNRVCKALFSVDYSQMPDCEPMIPWRPATCERIANSTPCHNQSIIRNARTFDLHQTGRRSRMSSFSLQVKLRVVLFFA